jgi:hypothetical protein
MRVSPSTVHELTEMKQLRATRAKNAILNIRCEFGLWLLHVDKIHQRGSERISVR